MTPQEQQRFDQGIHEILREHPEGITEGAIVRELDQRGFITPAMKKELEFEGAMTYLYYIAERKVLWTKVSPRQIRRQRQRGIIPPIVQTGILCDREGRTLCTVSQDATGEYHFPTNIKDYMPQAIEAYPMHPSEYERPNHQR